jgi:uncharacterized protein
MVFEKFEQLIEVKIKSQTVANDPAHDFLHFKRVVKSAKQIGLAEKANLDIVVPAAWLHDLVNVPKNDSRRSEASKLSAREAIIFLKEINYPEIFFEEIAHAIEAHSFSANIQTRSLESQVVQDADRLDSIGAIGLARCFATAAVMKRPLYSEHDSFCAQRPVDDSLYTIDHFYKKLLVIEEKLNTKTAKSIGQRRTEYLKNYLNELKEEI